MSVSGDGPVSWNGKHLLLVLKVQPKASRNAFAEVMNGELKLAITAPPVDGKANKHLIKLLAKWFAVPTRQVSLLSGETSRHKRIQIEQPQQIPEPVAALLDNMPES